MYDLASQTGSTEGNGVRARHGRRYGDSAWFATGRGKAGALGLRWRPDDIGRWDLLLAAVEQRVGIADRLAACIEDPRAPERVRHTLAEMIRFRALLIAAGYPDGNDCDALRSDPAFKLVVGRLPDLSSPGYLKRLSEAHIMDVQFFAREHIAEMVAYHQQHNPIIRQLGWGKNG